MVLGDYGILYERIELSMGETEGDLKALLREVVLTSAQTRRGKSCGWNPVSTGHARPPRRVTVVGEVQNPWQVMSALALTN